MPLEVKTLGGRVDDQTAQVIPDDELWLHAPEAKASLDRALAWSECRPRAASDLAVIAKRVKREK
jgi:hypothetical protein